MVQNHLGMSKSKITTVIWNYTCLTPFRGECEFVPHPEQEILEPVMASFHNFR